MSITVDGASTVVGEAPDTSTTYATVEEAFAKVGKDSPAEVQDDSKPESTPSSPTTPDESPTEAPAPEDESDEDSPEDAGEPAPTEAAPTPSKSPSRWQRLRAERDAAREQNLALTQVLARLSAPVTERPAGLGDTGPRNIEPVPAEIPTEEAFFEAYPEASYADYQRVVARIEAVSVVRQEFEFHAQQDARRRADEVRQIEIQAWGSKLDEARKEYPDWDEVLSDDLPEVAAPVAEAIMRSPHGTKILRHLAENRQEAQAFAAIRDARSLERAMGRLEERVSAAPRGARAAASPPLRTETRAPRVVPPVAASVGASEVRSFRWADVGDELSGENFAAAKRDYMKRSKLGLTS